MRSSTADIAVRLTPPLIPNLNQPLDCIVKEEPVEVTAKSIRLPKRSSSLKPRGGAG